MYPIMGDLIEYNNENNILGHFTNVDLRHCLLGLKFPHSRRKLHSGRFK